MRDIFARIRDRLNRLGRWVASTGERIETRRRHPTRTLPSPPGVDSADPLAADLNTTASTHTDLFWRKAKEEVIRQRELEVSDLRLARRALATAGARVRNAAREISRRQAEAKEAETARDAYRESLNAEQRGLLDRRLPRGGLYLVYGLAFLVEYIAFRSAVLILDVSFFESFLLALLVAAPVYFAHEAGGSLKRLFVRRADPEAAPVTVSTWIPPVALAGLVITVHFVLAAVRQAAIFDLGYSGLVIPTHYFMLMTLSAALVTAAAAYRWTNPLQDRLDALEAALLAARRGHEASIRTRDAEEVIVEAVAADIASTMARYRARREAIVAHAEVLNARIRLANPQLWGVVAPVPDPVDTATPGLPELHGPGKPPASHPGDPSNRPEDEMIDLNGSDGHTVAIGDLGEWPVLAPTGPATE